MRRAWLALAAALLVGCVGLRPNNSAATPTARPAPGPIATAASAVGTTVASTRKGPSHVFVVIMENHEYEQVVDRPEAPYTNQLARDYGLAAQYYGVAHPSLPNYLAMLAGDTLGVDSDCTACFQTAPTLADQLEAAGRSWKSYQEGLPAPCYLGAKAGAYSVKHNPFLYFQAIRTDKMRCADVVPLGQLDADLAADRVPDLVFVTPNLTDDMHDGSVAEGDRWLAAFVPKVLGSPAWREGGVLVVTWDEGTTSAACCGAGAGGHVPAIVAAAEGPRGRVSSTPANHYGLLHTIEAAWDLPYLARAADPANGSLTDLFSPP